MQPSYYYNSPVRLLALIVTILFVIELSLMLIMGQWDIKPWYFDLIDACMLAFLLTPTLYFLAIRPLMQQKEQIEADEASFRKMAEHIPDGLISINAKGIIQQTNPALLKIFGYDLDDLLGTNVSCLMPTPYSEEHDGYLQHFLKTNEQHVIGCLREIEGRCKNGDIIDIELQVSNVSVGQHYLFVGLIRDISQRKKMDEERQVMRKRAEGAQRLESLGVLAGGVAHDFNNILSSIMGNASVAQMQLQGNEPLCKMMRNIEDSSVRASDLCKQMLAYAGKGRFVVSECDVSEIVRSIHTLITSSTPNHIKLAFDLKPDLPKLKADASQLQQVIMNLYLNAVEALENNTSHACVRISTGCLTLNEAALEDCIAFEQGNVQPKQGRYIFIAIEDNGGGIHPSIIHKIFNPFFTTHFAGRGLGLSASLGIMRSQGGVMQCDNKVGEGITMRAFFPVVKPQAQALSKLGWILVADNDASSIHSIVSILDTLGLKSITASNGEDARQLFHEHEQHIGLLVLKMRLLKSNGVECLRSMRQQKPTVQAILISSYDEAKGNSRLAHDEGAYFLLKPINQEKLVNMLHTVLLASYKKLKEMRK
ncbi:MAG: PAS domain S-box protein [Mariprofundaceae bacterium]|nr:PAS domain S-box protein [Mariprofundaceae bacterium]